MFRYKIGSAVVSVCLLLGTADAASGQAASPKESGGKATVKISAAQTDKAYAHSTVDRLNVRTSPKLTAAVIQQIGKSGSYEILAEQKEWLKIRLTDQTAGWVFHEYVERTKAAPKTAAAKSDSKPAVKQPEPTPAKQTVVKIIDRTNLRKGPGTDQEIVGKGMPGETYPIVAKEGDWYQIRLGAKATAYVASWVVETDIAGRSANEDSSANKQVYIYHTHNRESWKNVASQTKGASVDDRNVNITLVGKQVGAELQRRGISALAAQDDFAERLAEKKLGYAHSYAESRKAVQAAAKANPSLGYFFDIHRDGEVPKAQTTVTLNGKTYARLLFVIGTGHANYKQNKKLAEALNSRLEKKYPGLSRGVLLKDAEHGDGEYNQSLSPGSLLLEFGSANNTLQESLRTAEAFAEVFADYYEANNK
ncbi:stage II sporulation protein P [Paenibacillus sp. UNCCL117]|uniref:stage II sporulation protein P n=1 Tax=unclassified Paenibacillus TaxID=185978 RepID=UPI00088C2E38|nr:MULTISPECIES: stage II sporulation protein P [unclassified Paenibacillus]SDC93854.1 stage II sporulation protein P [Paenibacillus sp. cl123]SFW29659.1 stage II sporulation protein P [Paenibacillus sp. UNCCL117]